MQTTSPEIITQFITSIFIALLLVGFIIIIFLLSQKKKMIQEKEMSDLKLSFEKDLLQTQLEIQETVLKNVSMELHDNIGQVMLLVNVNNSLLQTMPGTNESAGLIRENKALVSKAMEDISQLSRSFHSDRISDIGVFKAIEHEVMLLHQKGIYKVTIHDNLSENDKQIGREASLVVFRMYQEIIKNIFKHAEADGITVLMDKEGEDILLRISDNGKGFDTLLTGNEHANGVGLRSLKTRINLINGRILVTSEPGQGTSVAISIPINKHST